MENGEVAAPYSLARERDIPIGVLLQPYIDLDGGWRISYMGETYAESGSLHVQAAIEASRILLKGKGVTPFQASSITRGLGQRRSCCDVRSRVLYSALEATPQTGGYDGYQS
jgi:hypothetical protein